MDLSAKTLFVTGASRGIGEAIALRAAADGANVVIAAKTDKPHPRLDGTIHSVAAAVEAAGGHALPLMLDVRDDQAITNAVSQAVAHFGGIDCLVNNASAINLTNTPNTPMRRFDLMMQVNVRATFACSQACLPHLQKAANPHILTLSPPLALDPKWFRDNVAYTISKYGMSMCTLGMAAEFAKQGIAVNSLWPRTTIATAAVKVHFPPELWQASRTPQIMADAAYWILTQPARELSGQFLVDETVLRQTGIEDFTHYAIDPSVPPFTDLFLD